MTQAYPLQWPKGRPFNKGRAKSNFRVKSGQAYLEMMDELHKFGVADVVVSSNIPLRRDGTPYRDGLSELFDNPGVAVYFTRKKRAACLCCDTYKRPWENIRAIGLSVAAFRSMARHGADQILDQAFEGFTALPSPEMAGQEPDSNAWWAVLGVNADASAEQAHAAYKAKCREAGGATAELNAAKDIAMAGGS